MVPSANDIPQEPHYRTYNGEFLNPKGKKIQCYYWEPKEQPKALLFICHGFTDHTMLYESMAKEMARRKFYVFAHDHVGHGKSGGKRTHMKSIHHLVEDVMYHINQVRKKLPDLPLFLFGHSLGGAVSILTSLQKKANVKGMVLLAPALAPNPETATPLKIMFAKVFAVMVPRLPIVYADVSLSIRDPVQIERFNKDPLRYHGYFQAKPSACLLKGGKEILKMKGSVEVPYMLLHGDGDKVCNITGSQAFHAGSSSEDKTFITYPGAYHSLFHEPEDTSSDVFKRSVQWLSERA